MPLRKGTTAKRHAEIQLAAMDVAYTVAYTRWASELGSPFQIRVTRWHSQLKENGPPH